MKYLQSQCHAPDRARPSALHALDERLSRIYTYVQELKTWNRDPLTETFYFFPELCHRYLPAFTALTRDEVYPLLEEVPRFDRRDEGQRRLSDNARAQLRRSGKVLTSAEIGLITKHLKQRVSVNPAVKQVVEVRSRYRRWTSLILQESDGAARRQAVKSLRESSHLQKNSVGQTLQVRHKTQRLNIDNQERDHMVIQVKYETGR